jgi:GTPase SAR1 family protein
VQRIVIPWVLFDDVLSRPQSNEVKMASTGASPASAPPSPQLPAQSSSSRTVKVVVLGDSGVGKSSIVMRFVTNTFKQNNEPTIGAAFMAKTIVVEGCTVNYQVWDTAGQERYHSIAR